MKSEQRSQAFLRRRKMMLVLPLLVIPFLTMAFWALDGGSGGGDVQPLASKGLNLNLPSSKMEENAADNKLSFYDRAERDSAKMEAWMRNDPYYNGRGDTAQHGGVGSLENFTTQSTLKYNQQLNTTPYESTGNNPEKELMEKMARLQTELAKPSGKTAKPNDVEAPDRDTKELDEQMARLQAMIEDAQTSDSEDPTMKQIGTTLDKILDIQHPERVKARLQQNAPEQKTVTYSVTKPTVENNISLLGFTNENASQRFYSLEHDRSDTINENAFEAEVFTAQTIVNGSVVRLHTTAPFFIKDKLIPKGTYVNGFATLNNERLEVEIASIRTGNTLLPVRLTIYDMDGLPGIYIPGAIPRDVAKQ